MSKRTQLWIALAALGVVIVLLVVLFVAVAGQNGDSSSLDQIAPQEAWQEPTGPPPDPTAGREERAQEMVWAKTAEGVSDGDRRLTVRQAVETDLLRTTFPGLHWERVERVGWRAFQQEDSVYEVQFVLQDVGVEFGPAWLVQTDPAGLQPPGSGGVVPANVFAEVIQRGRNEFMDRYLGREAEVVQALTNHRFDEGARLASAMLIFFRSRHGMAAENLMGWTVVPEWLVEGEPPLYRAFFQWREAGAGGTGGRTVFASWQIDMETQQFRGLNLLASEIMAGGDEISAEQLESIRPRMIDERQPSRTQRRLFEALRTIVDNERLLEAVTALLWHRSQHGAEIEYQHWNARRDSESDSDAVFEVSYAYLIDEDPAEIRWLVDLDSDQITPIDDLARMATVPLSYELLPVAEHLND